MKKYSFDIVNLQIGEIVYSGIEIANSQVDLWDKVRFKQWLYRPLSISQITLSNIREI